MLDSIYHLTLKLLKNHIFGAQNTRFSYLLRRVKKVAQWLSGRELDSRPRGCGSEPHRRHCVVVLEQDTFILA